VKNKEKKGIAVFLVLFFFSVFYLVGHFRDLNLSTPDEWLKTIYKPVADLFFDVP
jgi:hypothetical protein